MKLLTFNIGHEMNASDRVVLQTIDHLTNTLID
jgi:hypothetical protein